MLFGNNPNLGQNQLLNARMQNLSADPSSPVVGQFYFNTVSAHAWIWTGATWEQGSSLVVTRQA